MLFGECILVSKRDLDKKMVVAMWENNDGFSARMKGNSGKMIIFER